jgi:Xaa-Pro aminopeptidase
MEDRNLDAILITGPVQHNPAMYYFTGKVHVTNADLIKKRGKPPILFHNPMEREEAARTDIRTKNLAEYRLKELLEECDGDHVKALAMRYTKMLSELEITQGRMAIYGMVDAGKSYGVFSTLQDMLPDLKIIGEGQDSLILKAMATKAEDEIEKIRRMGHLTTDVVSNLVDFLTSHPVMNDVLMKSDETPLTVGDVKNRIDLMLAERGADNPEGTIFAIGRDAGIPHSAGNPNDVIRIGKTIVFDIFPSESGGGYFYDFTRTWCLGYAPDEVVALYEDVLAVYQKIMAELKINTPCQTYQERTCELFEELGHKTVREDPTIQEGYVHSLGHGLGLHVHERPWFGQGANEDDILAPGVVVTIEPGLYYPSQDMGCRLEDTVWMRPDGQPEILSSYPLDLILPMRSV